MPTNKFPGKPLEVASLNIERLFKLSFLRSNLPDFELIYIPSPMEMPEIIDRCKEYCNIKFYRFISVRPAVRILE